MTKFEHIIQEKIEELNFALFYFNPAAQDNQQSLCQLQIQTDMFTFASVNQIHCFREATVDGGAGGLVQLDQGHGGHEGP